MTKLKTRGGTMTLDSVEAAIAEEIYGGWIWGYGVTFTARQVLKEIKAYLED